MIETNTEQPKFHHYAFGKIASGKESADNEGDPGDVGSIPGSGRSPGGGYVNPLQYSCLRNPTDRTAL